MSAAAAPAAEADDGSAQPASEKEPEMPGPRDESEEEEEEEEEDDEEEEKGGQGRASLTGGIFTSKVFFLPSLGKRCSGLLALGGSRSEWLVQANDVYICQPSVAENWDFFFLYFFPFERLPRLRWRV